MKCIIRSPFRPFPPPPWSGLTYSHTSRRVSRHGIRSRQFPRTRDPQGKEPSIGDREREMPQSYDPLSQEDDTHIDDPEIQNTDSPHAGLLPRPTVYYGDGPFSAPSSDDEDEDEVTEKDPSGSLNRVENGGLFRSQLGHNGLHVGGQKVCIHELLA